MKNYLKIFTALVFASTITGVSSADNIRQQMTGNITVLTEIDNDDFDFGNLYGEDLEFHGKSKWKALGLSLLIPGAGQYYTERPNRAKFFGGIEVLTWSGFGGLRIYGKWKKEDYISWAAHHAGADVNGKSDDFFEKMTYYDNLDEFNQFELLYEGSRAQPFPSTPEYYWNWDSDDNRQYYRDLRNDSKSAYRRSLLFLGVAVINRLLSGIDAYRSASSYNREAEFSEKSINYYSVLDMSESGRYEFGIALHF